MTESCQSRSAPNLHSSGTTRTDGLLTLDLAAHVETVEAREHQVEHHEVGLEQPAGLDPGGAVGGDGHREALAAEPGGHRLGDRRFVLDHHDGAGEGRSRGRHAVPA